jgi:hypothetical protein
VKFFATISGIGSSRFRYSNRMGLGVSDVARTDLMLKGSTGKRLTYRRAGEGAHA